MRQWVEGPVTHTQEYIEWYRKNTTQFLFVAQQQNDPRTTIIHNVVGTTIEETYFLVPHPQSTFCTPHVHQTFGQTRELVNGTNPEWMTNLFGVDLNTPNSAVSYLVSLQQFDAPYSFEEQGQNSLVVATHSKNPEREQQHHHHKGELVIQERRNS